jgi:hypothetical protein
MGEKDSTDTFDISDATLSINDTNAVVEEGELVVRDVYLYSATDAPDDPTQVQRELHLDIELANPDGIEFTLNKELRELVEKWRGGEKDYYPAEARECANELEELIDNE